MGVTVKRQTESGGLKTALLLGTGFSARALIPHLLSAGYKVVGTSRKAEECACAEALLGIKMLPFDGAVSTELAAVIAESGVILSSISPSAEGDPFMSAINGQFQAAAPNCTWAGYLSAASVYGDRQGHWVYEDELLRPVNRRGVQRIEAELAWLESGAPVHIFRLSGIYGPPRGGVSRNPFKRLRAGTARAVIKPGHVVNRIFVDDIASAVMASIARPDPTRIYNLADDAPAPPQDVINFAAGLLGMPQPPQLDYETAEISKMARSFYLETKRVSNQRAKDWLGWSPQYPDYQSGLRAILLEEKSNASFMA